MAGMKNLNDHTEPTNSYQVPIIVFQITNIKKTLKSTHAEEESMVTESVSTASDKPSKKTSKTKG